MAFICYISQKRTALWLSFFLLSMTITPINGQKSTAFKEAYNNIWSLKLNDARIQPFNATTEELYIRALTDFMEAYISDNETLSESVAKSMAKQIIELERIKSENALIFAAELYMLKAALRAKHNSRVGAGWDFWKGYRLAKSNIQKNPQHPQNMLHWGIIECGIGSMPEDLQRYLSWLGFSGDLDNGLTLLFDAHQISKHDAQFNHLQVITGMAYVSSEVQLNNNSQIRLEKLGLNPLASPIMCVVEAKILFDQSKAQKAFDLLEQRQVHSKESPFPYLSYLKGRIAVTIEHQSADKFLLQFLKETEGQFFVASTHRYLWWHYHLNNNQQKATFHRQKISELQTIKTGADELAAYEANFPLNTHLLRARLLFDQGKFRQCLAHITSKLSDDVCYNNREKGEYFYRLGRCHQSLNQPQEAIKRLNQSIGFYGDLETFERANGLLQVAMLHEGRQECELATGYYKQVLSFSSYPFYEGIHQKAKSGVKRCKS